MVLPWCYYVVKTARPLDGSGVREEVTGLLGTKPTPEPCSLGRKPDPAQDLRWI